LGVDTSAFGDQGSKLVGTLIPALMESQCFSDQDREERCSPKVLWYEEGGRPAFSKEKLSDAARAIGWSSEVFLGAGDL
jgi:hypothetical protein